MHPPSCPIGGSRHDILTAVNWQIQAEHEGSMTPYTSLVMLEQYLPYVFTWLLSRAGNLSESSFMERSVCAPNCTPETLRACRIY